MTPQHEAPLLPLAAAPRDADWSVGDACSIDDDGCITCGDVAVELLVVEAGEHDALCRDGEGRTEVVATELVGEVAAGDRVLVHAKVAIERFPAPDTEVETHALR
ncbi:MAG TPA: HypC/HybG/HupF family hydrogenase formation chaperone [Euzebyales bacterium]|nr:HypC/HybG/HupF family hydrogenase formation chaperone [Euzebyales bacterium]